MHKTTVLRRRSKQKLDIVGLITHMITYFENLIRALADAGWRIGLAKNGGVRVLVV